MKPIIRKQTRSDRAERAPGKPPTETHRWLTVSGRLSVCTALVLMTLLIPGANEGLAQTTTSVWCAVDAGALGLGPEGCQALEPGSMLDGWPVEVL